MNYNEKERLLCYASGILGSTLANPNNTYTPDQLMGSSIRAAYKMINTIMDDDKLKEVLKNV
jgi:hypothetical protein